MPFTFVRFGGHAGKSPGHAGKTIFLRSIFNYTEKSKTIRYVELQITNLLERQSESALRMADTVNSYTHDNVTGLAFA